LKSLSTAQESPDHEYESIEQIKAIMSQKNCPYPTAFERAQYTRALKSYPRNQPSTAQNERDGNG
jgi:dihydroorotate dehydrogenase (fumarate)